MGTKLKEGQVVRSGLFVNGYIEKEFIKVGNYKEEDIQQTYPHTGNYVLGTPSIDNNRREREYLILAVSEQHPKPTIGNRSSSYENEIHAIELNEDGSYDENNDKISFSTCFVYYSSIMEENIEIVGEMKKMYIRN